MYVQNSYVWPRKALEPAGRIVNYSTTAWSPSPGLQAATIYSASAQLCQCQIRFERGSTLRDKKGSVQHVTENLCANNEFYKKLRRH